MSDLQLQIAQISALLGVVQPLVVALVKQDRFSHRVNLVIAVALTAVISVVVCVQQGDLTLANWGTSMVALYTVGAVTYRNLWGTSGLGVEQPLESKTSV